MHAAPSMENISAAQAVQTRSVLAVQCVVSSLPATQAAAQSVQASLFAPDLKVPDSP
jgi:hypothetical protein